MIYEVQESAIAERLRTIAGIDTIQPEVESDFKKPLNEGKVAVFYMKSTFEERDASTKSIGYVVQPETMYFNIWIAARKRRGEGGLLDLLDTVLKYLVGYKTDIADKIYAVSFELDTNESGVWFYVLTVACKRLLVEHEEAVVLPGLTKITYEYEFIAQTFENRELPIGQNLDVEIVEILKDKQVKTGATRVYEGGTRVYFDLPFRNDVVEYVMTFNCYNENGRVEVSGFPVQYLDGFVINPVEECIVSYIAIAK